MIKLSTSWKQPLLKEIEVEKDEISWAANNPNIPSVNVKTLESFGKCVFALEPECKDLRGLGF